MILWDLNPHVTKLTFQLLIRQRVYISIYFRASCWIQTNASYSEPGYKSGAIGRYAKEAFILSDIRNSNSVIQLGRLACNHQHLYRMYLCSWQDSNLQPTAYKADALPLRHTNIYFCGDY